MPDAASLPSGTTGRLRPRLIRAAGEEIAMLRLGSPSRAPLLLVHGFSGDMMTWQLNIGALAQHFHVVAIDLPGHGSSSAGDGVGHWRAMADWFEEFLAAMAIERPHLVGHSLGGRLCLALAERDALSTRTITLIACAGITPSYDYQFLVSLTRIETFDDALSCARRLFGSADIGLDRFARALLVKLSSPEKQKNLERYLAENFADGQLLPGPPVAWQRIRTPIQLIWGRDDTIIAPPPRGWVPDTYPSHVLERVGHMPHVAAADRVNRLIVEFAAHHDGAPSC